MISENLFAGRWPLREPCSVRLHDMLRRCSRQFLFAMVTCYLGQMLHFLARAALASFCVILSTLKPDRRACKCVVNAYCARCPQVYTLSHRAWCRLAQSASQMP
ncbi:hypothetical protein PLICRDRAFT_491463 [Plicaturopsis crispa FD-325 SS-3]|nr:hypothetical protein PLICRDRAFT_491463 [Plicaturopsis crispa FD-325 SS-3]